MTTKKKWQALRGDGPVRVIQSPMLVRASGWAVRFLLGAVLSGVELPLPALLTKVLSFVALGGFALYFNHRMYQELER